MLTLKSSSSSSSSSSSVGCRHRPSILTIAIGLIMISIVSILYVSIVDVKIFDDDRSSKNATVSFFDQDSLNDDEGKLLKKTIKSKVDIHEQRDGDKEDGDSADAVIDQDEKNEVIGDELKAATKTTKDKILGTSAIPTTPTTPTITVNATDVDSVVCNPTTSSIAANTASSTTSKTSTIVSKTTTLSNTTTEEEVDSLTDKIISSIATNTTTTATNTFITKEKSTINNATMTTMPIPVYTKDSIRIVYFGNSFLQVGNCPFVIQEMLKLDYRNVSQEYCLKGGATLETLQDEQCPRWFYNNNNIKNMVNPYHWDFAVLQDQSQQPARVYEFSRYFLRKRYAPLFFGPFPVHNNNNSSLPHRNVEDFTIPILLHTPAYQKPGIHNTHDLGDFDNFTNLLSYGYHQYATALNYKAGEALTGMKKNVSYPISRIAPNGEVYRWLYHNHPTLWNLLYAHDFIHPSAYGTYLEACVIYSTITGKVAPTYNPEWLRPHAGNNPLPSPEEAATLSTVAAQIIGIIGD